VYADWVAPGAHLNIIGGTHEDAIEVDPALLKTAFVVVETGAAAREDAGEVRSAMAQGYIQPEGLNELGAVVLGESAATAGKPRYFAAWGWPLKTPLPRWRYTHSGRKPHVKKSRRK
jgi:ornithine cyclodeaminase